LAKWRRYGLLKVFIVRIFGLLILFSVSMVFGGSEPVGSGSFTELQV